MNAAAEFGLSRFLRHCLAMSAANRQNDDICPFWFRYDSFRPIGLSKSGSIVSVCVEWNDSFAGLDSAARRGGEMSIKRRSGLILIGSFLAICWTGNSAAAGQSTPAEVREITMTARDYEFDPGVITVKKGDKVRLIITATDRKHGIKIEGYDIDQVLNSGVPTTIEFTADKVGTFEFKCSVYCGMGHRKMKGKLVVEE
jgi:cytochrome c oxidase subunit II